MIENLFMLLLKLQLHLFAAWKIPVLATLLVLGSTGFIVTGTISAEDGEHEHKVNLKLTPVESLKCLDALIAQTETLLQLDLLASDGTVQLRHLRDRAQDKADEQRKLLDEAALLAQVNTSSEQIRAALADARQQVFAAGDLGKCKDNDPTTTINIDVDVLRARYDEILRDFGRRLSAILADAQTAFDQLVLNAPTRPAEVSGGSHSRD